MKTYEEMAESVFLRIDEYNKRKKARNADIVKAISVFASLMIIALISINIFIPAYAREVPIIGGVFAFIQDKLDFMGIYTNYCFQVGDAAESNDVSITLSEVYCDGNNLFISYLMKGEELRTTAEEGGFNIKQVNYSGKTYISSEGKNVSLEDICMDVEVEGIEGEFIDDSTFAGVEIYCLKEGAFPEEFVLNISMKSIEFLGRDDHIIKGNWDFIVNVSCNYEDIVVYEVAEEKDQHSIDKIIVSPIMITVYSSYPDEYLGTVRYMLVAYSDISPDEDITGFGEFPPQTGITKIPRSRVEKVLDIYVYDRASFEKNEDPADRENIEKHAIVSSHLNLQ